MAIAAPAAASKNPARQMNCTLSFLVPFFRAGLPNRTWMAGILGENVAASAKGQLDIVYLGYLFFPLFMTSGTMETAKVLFFLFGPIDFLFGGLALGSLGIPENGMRLHQP